MRDYLLFIVKNALRSKRRAFLTMASVALSFCLLAVLMALYHALYLAPPATSGQPAMGIFFATSRITHLGPHQFFGIAFWIGFPSTGSPSKAGFGSETSRREPEQIRRVRKDKQIRKFHRRMRFAYSTSVQIDRELLPVWPQTARDDALGSCTLEFASLLG